MVDIIELTVTVQWNALDILWNLTSVLTWVTSKFQKSRFDLSIDMSRSTVTVLVECPGDPIKFDPSVEKGHKPVPEGLNAIRPVSDQ